MDGSLKTNNLKLRETLVESIEEMIYSGRLAPGTRITENALAEEFKVSRSLIREILLLLQQRGVIEILPYKGAVVYSFSYEELQQSVDFRACIEMWAVDMAFERITSEDIERLEKNLSATQKAISAQDVKAIFNCDLDFHKQLVAKSGNKYAIRALDQFGVGLRLYALKHQREVNELEKVHQHHSTLLTVLKTGDKEAFLCLLQNHLQVEALDSAWQWGGHRDLPGES